MKKLILFSAFVVGLSFQTIATLPLSTELKGDTLVKNDKYTIFSKTDQIGKVNIHQNTKKKKNVVYIHFGNPPSQLPNGNVAGAVQRRTPQEVEQQSGILFDKIDILNGNYDDIKVEPKTEYLNLYTLSNVTFPLRLKLKSGNNIVDLELKEAGYWDVEVQLKK